MVGDTLFIVGTSSLALFAIGLHTGWSYLAPRRTKLEESALPTPAE